LNPVQFSRPIESWPELREAIATYISRAAEKLRMHELTADAIQAFPLTSRFKENYFSESVTMTLDHSFDNTAEILRFALKGFDRNFQPGQGFTIDGGFCWVLCRSLSGRSVCGSRMKDDPMR
jgi:DNA polymerase V